MTTTYTYRLYTFENGLGERVYQAKVVAKLKACFVLKDSDQSAEGAA